MHCRFAVNELLGSLDNLPRRVFDAVQIEFRRFKQIADDRDVRVRVSRLRRARSAAFDDESFAPVIRSRIKRHAFENWDGRDKDAIVADGPRHFFANLVEYLAKDFDLLRQFCDAVAQTIDAGG